MVSPDFARASTGVTRSVNEGGPVTAWDGVTAVVLMGEGVMVINGVPLVSDPGAGVDATSVIFGDTGNVADPMTDSVGDVVSCSDIVGDCIVCAEVRVGDTSIEYSSSGLDPGGGGKNNAETIIPPITSAITPKSRTVLFWFIPENVGTGYDESSGAGIRDENNGTITLR